MSGTALERRWPYRRVCRALWYMTPLLSFDLTLLCVCPTRSTDKFIFQLQNILTAHWSHKSYNKMVAMYRIFKHCFIQSVQISNCFSRHSQATRWNKSKQWAGGEKKEESDEAGISCAFSAFGILFICFDCSPSPHCLKSDCHCSLNVISGKSLFKIV